MHLCFDVNSELSHHANYVLSTVFFKNFNRICLWGGTFLNSTQFIQSYGCTYVSELKHKYLGHTITPANKISLSLSWSVNSLNLSYPLSHPSHFLSLFHLIKLSPCDGTLRTCPRACGLCCHWHMMWLLSGLTADLAWFPCWTLGRGHDPVFFPSPVQ